MNKVIVVIVIVVAGLWPATMHAQAPRSTHYLYLIRHGSYVRDSLADDTVANGLDSLGHAQARLLARRLADLPIRFTRMTSSNYTRARETAADLGAVLGMTPIEDSLLHECGPTTDRPSTSSRRDAEDIALCDSNLTRAWVRYATAAPDSDRHELLVCHGNVIRWFVVRALGADTRRWTAMDIGNASITVIAVRSDGSTRLVMFSDVGHLPVAQQTWTGRGAGWGRRPPPPAGASR